MSGVRTVFRSEINSVKTELERGNLAVQSGFEKLRHGLKSAALPGEVSNVRELADLRGRVQRIEDHLKLRQDEPAFKDSSESKSHIRPAFAAHEMMPVFRSDR